MSAAIDRVLAGEVIESIRAASIKDRASFWQLFGSRTFPALPEPIAEAVRMAAAVELVASRMDGGLAFFDENPELADAGLARLSALDARQNMFDRARRLTQASPGRDASEEHAFARLLAAVALGNFAGAKDILNTIDRNVLSHPAMDVLTAYTLFHFDHDDEARQRLTEGIQKLERESYGLGNADFWRVLALVGSQDLTFLSLAAELFVSSGTGFDIDTVTAVVLGLAELSAHERPQEADPVVALRNSVTALLRRKDARDRLSVQKWVRAVDLITSCHEVANQIEEAARAERKRLRDRKKSLAEKASLAGKDKVSKGSLRSARKEDDGSDVDLPARRPGKAATIGGETGSQSDEARAPTETVRQVGRAQVQQARVHFAAGQQKRAVAGIENAYQLLGEKREVRVVQIARPIDIPSIPSVRRFEVGASRPIGPSPISRVDGDPLRPTSGLDVQWAAEIENASVLTGDRTGSVFWYVTTRDGWMLADGLNVHPRLHFGSLRERMSALSPAGNVLLDAPVKPSASTRVPGRSVLLGGVPNYYHWLMEYLPKIGQLESLMPDVPGTAASWLVNENLAPWQVECLSALGVPSDQLRLVRAAETVRCESLVVPSMMSAPDATRFLRARLSGERPLEGGRKLYVSRLDADAPRRRVYHEELLAAALQQTGFDILVPSEMSFQDQVDAFASAAVIVGPHGAGMTNLVFAQKDCVVVEIVNTHNQGYRFFSDIAETVGVTYARFLSGSERANLAEPENANSIVDPDRLLSFIDRLREGQSRQDAFIGMTGLST